MQIVIDIPDKIKETIDRGQGEEEFNIPTWLCHSIVNGTPLPKGHGRLIDADKLKCIRPQDVAFHKVLQHSKTVIKADKEND